MDECLCQCGCGMTTNRQTRSRRDRGYVIGQCSRFRKGHSGRKPDNYVVGESGCWEWQGARTNFGYGILGQDNKIILAHRFYYEKLHGPIPKGMVIDHLCRNPRCCNPDHLEVVTPAVNTQRKSSAKLNASIVAEIRRAYRAKEGSQSSLARLYGVSQGTVWEIVHNHIWRE